MKNMKRRIIIFMFLMTLGCLGVSAQSLSGETISSKLRDKAIILNDYQKMLADKDKSIEVKRHYMTHALNLFVNHGEPINADSLKYQGATISMKSSLRNKPVKRKAKDYLQGVMDLRYSPVDLSLIKVPALPSEIDFSDFFKYADNQYKGTVKVTRELAGYIDGTPVYRDITPYDYTLFISITNTIEGTEYIIYFGDIEIEENTEHQN